MTEIERKALALLNEVARERGSTHDSELLDRGFVEGEALCRAIEHHEAYRQEVSDAVEEHLRMTDENCSSLWCGVTRDNLARLIIAKPDPLVEAVKEASNPDYDCASPEAYAEVLRAALAARGLKIVEDK